MPTAEAPARISRMTSSATTASCAKKLEIGAGVVIDRSVDLIDEGAFLRCERSAMACSKLDAGPV